MCEACWHERGSPQVDTQQVRRLAELMQRMLDEQPHSGRWHIVLDDFNVEDEHVAFCLAEPLDRPGCEIDAALATLLPIMSPAERASGIALAEGWCA